MGRRARPSRAGAAAASKPLARVHHDRRVLGKHTPPSVVAVRCQHRSQFLGFPRYSKVLSGGGADPLDDLTGPRTPSAAARVVEVGPFPCSFEPGGRIPRTAVVGSPLADLDLTSWPASVMTLSLTGAFVLLKPLEDSTSPYSAASELAFSLHGQPFPLPT